MFDLTVHHRDPKTGAITKEDHYALHIGQDGHLFERPIGSGMMYYANGVLAKDLYKDKRESEAKAKENEIQAKADSEKKAQDERMASLSDERKKIIEEANREADAIVAEAKAKAGVNTGIGRKDKIA